MTEIPEHERVPACAFHLCRVCTSCGRVHHGGGDRCIGCWLPKRNTVAARDAFEEQFGIQRHPDADKMVAPTETENGVCICGHVLPRLTHWLDWPHQWSSYVCPACKRGFVDEDEFIAIYDDGIPSRDDDDD